MAVAVSVSVAVAVAVSVFVFYSIRRSSAMAKIDTYKYIHITARDTDSLILLI